MQVATDRAASHPHESHLSADDLVNELMKEAREAQFGQSCRPSRRNANEMRILDGGARAICRPLLTVSSYLLEALQLA